MDKITIERINKAHPKIRQELLSLYSQCNKLLPAGVRLRFAYVFRSPEEQHALFLQRPKVTNADSWQSIHNYGLAFDIVILYDKNGDGTFEVASWDDNEYWQTVVKFFKSKGLEHGGDWKTFKDKPHFQYKKLNGSSYKWQDLKSQIDNNKTINDNNIKYPII